MTNMEETTLILNEDDISTTGAAIDQQIDATPPAAVPTPTLQATTRTDSTSPRSRVASCSAPESGLGEHVNHHSTLEVRGYGYSHATASNPPVAGGYDELSPNGFEHQMSSSDNAPTFGPSQVPSSPRSMICSVLPVYSLPTCPLDHILTDFRNSRCDQLAQGCSLGHAIGPREIVVSGLFDRRWDSSLTPLSSVLCEVLSTFPHPTRTEKLAFFYVMYQTMKVSQDFQCRHSDLMEIFAVACVANEGELRLDANLVATDSGPDYGSACALDRQHPLVSKFALFHHLL